MTNAHMSELGAYFLGSVFLASLVAVGLVTGESIVWVLALLSAGAGYLCQVCGAWYAVTGTVSFVWATFGLWIVSALFGVASLYQALA